MARDRERTRRDMAGVGPDATVRSRLVPLHELDGYGVVDDEPDIRGWDVRTLSGRELGKVEDLLVDPERGEVGMVEVDLRDQGVHAEVPIRSMQLDRAEKVVVMDSADLDAGVRHDARARDRMDDAERERVRSSYAGGRATADADGVEEEIIERRPVIEEVVVRRRAVEE